jgi:hypothetical protein
MTFALPGVVMNIFLLRVSGLEQNIHPPSFISEQKLSNGTMATIPDTGSYIPDLASDKLRRRNKIISSLTWIHSTARVGLFVLFGWREPSYNPDDDDGPIEEAEEQWVWVDTGIKCVSYFFLPWMYRDGESEHSRRILQQTFLAFSMQIAS